MKLKVKIYKAIKKFFNKDIIIDVTGTILTPGNHGKDCLGNGEHYNKKGKLIECCCDECDYMLICFEDYNKKSLI